MIFCMSGGGSGSTFLIKRLRRLAPCIARPDVCFEKGGKRGVRTDIAFHRGGIPSDVRELFEERVNYRVRAHTIAEMFDQLFEWHYGFVVLSGNYVQVGHSIRDHEGRFVFVVRHPLHAMVSWYKHRHPEMLHGHKLNSVKVVEQYAEYWNRVAMWANEVGRVIRYEYAAEDANMICQPQVRAIFDKWTQAKRNYGTLSHDSEARLEELTHGQYTKLYQRWEV